MTAEESAHLPVELRSVEPSLLDLAFTHRSLCARELPHEQTNERLEFLGDAVVELVVSEYLYNQYPQEEEGVLTRYRSALVRTESLAVVADELELGTFLRLNARGDMSPDDLPDSVLANTYESVVGALYLDQGLQSARAFIEKYLFPFAEEFIGKNEAKDPKTLLQEKVQALGKSAPTYQTVSSEGPDHAKTFTVSVHVLDYEPTEGKGSSKQRAQQAAAEAFLKEYFPESV